MVSQHSKQFAFGNSAGFSLIELLITIAIVTIVTGIAITRYASFNSTVLLNSQAYEIATDIRLVQSYAVSASGVLGNYRAPFGIAFATNAGSYTLFQDLNNDAQPSEGETVEVVPIGSSFILSEICRGNDCDLSSLYILFQRPNFNPFFYSDTGSGNDIVLRIASDDETASTTVLVNQAGYVSVQ